MNEQHDAGRLGSLGFRLNVRTVFLAAFLAGTLIAISPASPDPEVVTAYRVSVNDPDRPKGLFWYKDDIRWCKPRPLAMHIAIDEGGVVRINDRVSGSLWNPASFERDLREILASRSEWGAVYELQDDRAAFVGSKRVTGEYMISAPAATKYGDLIRIVDLIMSYGRSSVIIEPVIRTRHALDHSKQQRDNLTLVIGIGDRIPTA